MRKLLDPTGLIALAYDLMLYFVPLELLPLTGMNPVPVQIVSVALSVLAYTPIQNKIYQLKEQYGKKVLWILLVVFILLSALFLIRFNETESLSGYVSELVKEGLLYCVIPDLILYFYHVLKLNRTSNEAVKNFGSGSKGLNDDFEPEEVSAVECGTNKPIEGDYDTSLAAVCTNGTFVGRKNGQIISFLGVPYACPPVGPLRWKAPQRAKDDDTGVYEAFSYGKAPIQFPSRIMGIALENMDEDCLTLNVWKNAKAPYDSLLPVLVFLNTPDFLSGGTQNPYYDGDMFVKNHPDVMFVNINFRLGIFGSLDLSSLPGGEAYPDSTCLMLLDQICALKWIRENIEAFGGDSENVTVAGSMCGAVSTLLLTQMSEGRGLFHRAMILGGEWSEVLTLKMSRETNKKLLEYLGVHTLQDLDTIPYSKFLEAEKVFEVSACMSPVLDGVHLPLHPFGQFQKDAAPDVNLVFFTNEDEPYGTAMLLGGPEADQEAYAKLHEMLSLRKDFNETFQKIYEARNAVLHNHTRAFLQTFGCLFCTAPYFHACRSQAFHGGKARMLLWRLDSAVEEFRSNSLLQTAFFLGKVDDSVQFGITGDSCYSQILMQMTVNFMKCGNPSIREGQVRNIDPMDWPRFTRKESPIMVLDENGYSLDNGDFEKQMSMLNDLSKFYMDGID